MSAQAAGGITSHDTFDYIIVGAGTAGCALAGSLASRLPSARIALVESGGDAMAISPTIAMPHRWPKNFGGEHDWGFTSAPQPKLKSRRLQYPHGRGLGGSSLLNVMLYSRGFKKDWDLMPAGWRSHDVEPLFDALEAQLGLSKISVGEFGAAVASAADACGLGSRHTGEWEEHGTTTTYRAFINSSTGQRLDIYRTLNADRSNVSIICSTVERLLVDLKSRRVLGLILRKGPDQTRAELQVHRSGEVILCAGALGTPKILQLSGIGPQKLLQEHGIEIIQELPVGQGLQDHTLLSLVGLFKVCPSESELSPNSVQGWIHDEPNGVQIVMIDGRAAADIIPLGMVMPFTGTGCVAGILRGCMRGIAAITDGLLSCLPPVRHQCQRVVGLNVCLVRPTSRGTVMIRSSDSSVSPVVDPNFLASDEDYISMKHGIATVRRLLATPPLKECITADLSLGERFDETNAEFQTCPYWHPTGTCRIGKCVDSELRVLGLNGLRIADASVLPVHPRVGPAASCMVVGLRCAELLVQTAHQN